MKNESGIEKFRSRDQRIFEENRFYEIKTLTHNHVNTISDKRSDKCIESALKFRFEICAYVDTCLISNSRIAQVQKNRLFVITSHYVIAAS